jgi:tetratricopeptide (TPR) repeat protein
VAFKKSMKKAPIAAIGLVGFLVYQCGGNGPTGFQFRNPEEFTAEGWQAFESGDYALAVAKFDSAGLSDPEFSEGLNGAGWSYGRLGEFDSSGVRFEAALGLDENFLEASAGGALAFHALNRFSESIAEANNLLNRDPNFVFSHDAAIDALDIRITLAQSYFSIAQFDSAANQMDIIDPQASPHSTQPDELLLEIMRFFRQIR